MVIAGFGYISTMLGCQATQPTGLDPAALRWLPLVSRRATDWVVLLDPVTARVRGYVHLDGF
jgi:hypothetical protein